MEISKKQKDADIEYATLICRYIRHEQDAIAGTLANLKQHTNDPVIIARVETLMTHCEELGKLKLALKTGSSII